MELFEAFDISLRNRDMLSFVGGGGKTSCIYRLAQELRLKHKQVLVTTTTHIYYPDFSLYDRLFLWDRPEIPITKCSDRETGFITVVGSHITDELKLKGIGKEQVNELFDRNIFA